VGLNTICTEVQAARPTSLIAAIGLAQLYEAKQQAQYRNSLPEPLRPPNLPPMPSWVLTLAKNPQIKKLIAKELKDRRGRGLCLNCDEKFKPGHLCAKLFWLELKDDEEEALPEWVDKENFKGFLKEGEELPAISLHAITEAHGPCTIWIKKTMGGCKILLLFDSGSMLWACVWDCVCERVMGLVRGKAAESVFLGLPMVKVMNG
jgi:hypothetical protein